jgi:hypothetical protein
MIPSISPKQNLQFLSLSGTQCNRELAILMLVAIHCCGHQWNVAPQGLYKIVEQSAPQMKQKTARD